VRNSHLWAAADVRVAHNLEYDERVINAAIEALGRKSVLKRPPACCTKELAALVLNLPPTERMVAAGYGGKPKPPRLEECHQFFFGTGVEGAHSALSDARACAEVYLELLRRGAAQPGGGGR